MFLGSGNKRTYIKNPKRNTKSILKPRCKPTGIFKREPTRRKKKEERFNRSGQVFMRWQRSAPVLVPRSKVHIQTVTLGESWKLIK